MNLAEIVQRGWDAVGRGDFDALVADYVDDMTFIMPGQNDVLHSKQAFRQALNGLGDILPPGFEITAMRQVSGDAEVITVMEWKSEKISSSQLLVLFKFTGDKVHEERWFIDTEQWKSAF
ncbi:nuclear transport factor 2 family protein [Thalassotalea sp. Y01]|uniref:nuclear transport factor 2 family protein n=1 Tax=Thalassotalea sp. Y01 TaxID=2729613 RepID=UPI00145C8502|nr:nuclear transport factor 2 family protein [Thalassotalea sp. Y01]NMP16322.1 nuclear transport factor 2 family protein [Thalassotalea sp. Y01]